MPGEAPCGYRETGVDEGYRGMTDSVPSLVVEDLHKSFGSVEVLKGVSVTARKGDVISMLGSSGSGKSTFLRCISGAPSPPLLSKRAMGVVVLIASRADLIDEGVSFTVNDPI